MKRWGRESPPEPVGLESAFGIHAVPQRVFPPEPTEPPRERIPSMSITYNGQTKTVRQWAKEKGMSYSTLKSRLTRWPVEMAMETPVDGGSNHWLIRKRLKEMG